MYRCNCGKEYYNKTSFDKHKENCQNGNLSCQLCNKNIAACDMDDHLLQCSNRNVQCPICLEDFPRGSISYHLDNNCVDLVDNNTDLVNNNNHHKPSSSTFVKEQLFRSNEAQEDDVNFIPCELCHEQIWSIWYYKHLMHCPEQHNPCKLDHAKSSTNSTVYEETTATRAENNKKSNFKSSNVAGSLAEGHFDTLNTSVGRLNLNSDKERINTSTREKSISKESPNLILHRKVDHAKNDLHEDYYPNEVDHVVKRLQFNVLISGSPRVGKSQLINALCGGEKLAKTSASLGSCTTKVECYTLEDNQQQTPGINPFRINFYDTPGIESWIDQNGQAKMLDYIRETDPVCLIYCASPGSYANLDQLEFVLKYCHENQIFCALVCTNMWAGDGGARNGVLKDFEKELAFFGARVKKQFEQQHDQSLHEVIHFGDGALCTMVNSKEYRNKDFSNIIKPVQGIDELIHSIMEKLDDKKIRGWCHAVLYRRSYWEKIEQKAAGFVSARMNYLANNLLKYYYEVEIKNLQFNILIIGSPRVGKSQLINALFGDENLAKTSASLDSCTKEVKCYTMKTNKEQTPDIDLSEIHFYDTPGVESWTDEKGIMTMKKFLEDTNPICIIYCASPGSFVDLKQLHQLLEFCKEKQIFCALVCTNMWASVNQKVVMEEFERQLKFFGDRKEKLFQQEYGQLPHKVIFFGDGALCTMVNSKEYYDPEFSPVRKPVQGIDELIHCIMEKLDGEKLLGWCHAVLYHRSYWEKIKQKTAGFVSARMKNAANWSNMMFGPTAKNAAFFLKKFLE